MPSQNLRVATWVPPGVVPVLGQMIGVSQVSPVLDTEFTTPAVPEAPEDAKLYGRKDAAWALVPPLPFAADAPANTNWSTATSLTITSKWRWQPVEAPVVPLMAMTSLREIV